MAKAHLPAPGKTGIRSRPNQAWIIYMKKYRMLYFLSIPGIAYFLAFRYTPLLGSVMAFQDYDIYKGIAASPWIGLDHFKRMFAYPDFLHVLSNTFLIALYDLAFAFPVPIILALLLNEVRLLAYKRFVQTVQSKSSSGKSMA